MLGAGYRAAIGWGVVLACSLLPALPSGAPGDAGAGNPEFDAVIAGFERSDARARPTAGGVLFIGSSSIRLWDSLAADMAPLPVINRGFGGSTGEDVLRYLSRIVLPYRPRAVVYYAGDNDIGRDGDPPAAVLRRFQTFVAQVQSATDSAPDIYFLSIKPSPARMDHWPQMQEANRLIRRYAAAQSAVSYIDVAGGLLDAAGRPRAECYQADGIHLSAAGYRVWARAVRPAVMASLGDSALYL